MKMELSAELFKTRKKLVLYNLETNTNYSVIYERINIKSQYNKTTARTVKCSNVGILFSEILSKKKNIVVMVSEATKTIYYRRYRNDGTYRDCLVSYNDTSAELIARWQQRGHEDATFPIALWVMLFGDRLNEITDTLEKVVDPAISDEAVILKACDSFYYGWVKNHPEVTVYDEQIENVVKAGCIQGSFQNIQNYRGVSVYKNFMDTPEDLVGFVGSTKSQSGSISQKDMDLFEECKKGKHILPIDWGENAKPYIESPSKLAHYVPTKEFFSILRKIEFRFKKIEKRLKAGMKPTDAIGMDYINILLNGVPGTGKTTLVHALGQALGMPVYLVSCEGNAEEDEFQGKTKPENGSFVIKETSFVKGFVNGGLVILEEVNLLAFDVAKGALGQAIESPFILKYEGVSDVYRNPYTVIVGTMNSETGLGSLEASFSNRFKQSLLMEQPSKEHMISCLMAYGYAEPECLWVYDLFTKIMDELQNPELMLDGDFTQNISLRTCYGCLQEMEEGSKGLEAARNTFIGKIAEKNTEVAKLIEKSILATYREFAGTVSNTFDAELEAKSTKMEDNSEILKEQPEVVSEDMESLTGIQLELDDLIIGEEIA